MFKANKVNYPFPGKDFSEVFNKKIIMLLH